MSDEMRKYMDKVQAGEPRAIIVAQSMTKFRAWCFDHELDPQRVRLGKHPDYLTMFLAGDGDPRRMSGLRRGLKWIEVGNVPRDLKEYLTKIRLADWQ